MDKLGLKLRKLRAFNRDSKARILAHNISKVFEDTSLVRDLEQAFTEIDRVKQAQLNHWVEPEL